MTKPANSSFLGEAHILSAEETKTLGSSIFAELRRDAAKAPAYTFNSAREES
ncbi:hypothetical protein OC844_006641, partial [Tilletia horrida]